MHDTTNQAKTTYTWEDVAVHNSSHSCWIIVDKKVYDITEWIEKHPGGPKMLLLFAGRDCTDVLDVYHPFQTKPRQLLRKFYKGELAGTTEFVEFAPDTGFYKKCRERVAEYFHNNNIDPKDPWPGTWRMLLVLGIAVASFCGAFIPGPHTSYIPIQVLAAATFGWMQALLLLHIMHDCSHTAFTSTSSQWMIVGKGAMDWLVGASLESWLNQHVVGHHTYTNVVGADPDLPIDFEHDFRRIVHRQLIQPLYTWQHLYLPPLYGLLGLKFRLQDITGTFASRTNGPVRVNPHTLTTWVLMLSAKAFWAWYRIYIPLAILHMDPLRFCQLFFFAELITGWYLAFNFQVSHVSTGCDYLCDDDQSASKLSEEWAIAQVRCSIDYGQGSRLTTFLSGALNYQTTHHLFPSVSQYHYPAIAPIVMQVCKEHNIKYNVLPSFSEALAGHFAHLKKMGSMGKPVHVHMG